MKNKPTKTIAGIIEISKQIKLIMFLFALFITSYFKLSATEKFGLQITEFMASNSNVLKDEDGDYSDWIEILNNSTSSVNLNGWYLTDNSKNLTKWKFPEKNLLPGQYLIVFATGKDRIYPASNLHTNFKLSASGEYLALIQEDGVTIEFDYLSYPQQFENISYGIAGEQVDYFEAPTPGGLNVRGTFIPPPVCSIPRGFYESPIEVELSTTIPGAVILYTTDGSKPTLKAGKIYKSKILVNTTTILRAAVFNQGNISSREITNTYLFLKDVVNQPSNPVGYPAKWGPYSTISGTATADYEMDPQICKNPVYADLMVPSLLSIPTISIVTDINNLFSDNKDPLKGGIYTYPGPPTGGLGLGWEREASVEYFGKDIKNGLQVNCGLRIHGGHSRLPEKSPKHSLRLLFKGEYGPAKLKYDFFDQKGAAKEFNTLILRAGFGNTWNHWDTRQRDRAQYTYDSWAKDTQLDMACPSEHNKFVHLYLNGLYWGIYNISELVTIDYVESYFKGKKEEYDIVKDYQEVEYGDITAWEKLQSYANSGLSDNAIYQKILGKNPDGTDNPDYEKLLDVDNLIDYMLLNFYGGNNDWDHHNWTAVRRKGISSEGFKFFVWDSELLMDGLNDNMLNENNAGCPSRIYQKLTENKDFKILFADHVQKLFFDSGALTPQASADRFMKRDNEIDLAIISESARWGDYRRDMHPWQSAPFLLYTKEEHWKARQKWLLDEYFPARTKIVLDQIKSAGLFPNLSPPIFGKNGGEVPEGFALDINAAFGTICYTTDGSDPRAIGGETNPKASIYEVPFVIKDTITIKARTRVALQWSTLTEAKFKVIPKPKPVAINMQPVFINQKNYPNPVKNYTNIYYTLPEAGNVDISIYLTDGRLVNKVFSGYQPAGSNTVTWQPEGIQSGIYLYKIKYNQTVFSGKLMLLK